MLPPNVVSGPTRKAVDDPVRLSVVGAAPNCVNRGIFNVPLLNPPAPMEIVLVAANVEDALALLLNDIPLAPPLFATEIFPL
ncbi:MAG: hypothetical protein IPK96_07420 [Flammeovirgaceae bacterium]|nr:hypothetical protein [Flammeovirgaceae bacterium]